MSNNRRFLSHGLNTVAYQKRVNDLKEKILRVSERNMENTVWVLRRWLRNETDLINRRK